MIMRSLTVFATAMFFYCVATAVDAQPENVKPYNSVVPRKAAAAAAAQEQLLDPHNPKPTTLKDTTAVVEPRIIGGEDADEGEFPFYVYLYIESGISIVSMCGGSLIHKDIILTAAHCKVSEETTTTAYVGTYNLDPVTLEPKDGEPRQIEESARHPDYNDITYEYDVMVLKIDSPSSLPIVMLNDNFASPADGENVVAIGLGDINPEDANITFPEVLQKVTVPVVAYDQCAVAYPDLVETVQLCAGLFEQGGKDTCQGDSGGPLLDLQAGVQVGVTSVGLGCAQPNLPGIYTRVSAVKSWIDQMICELSDSPPASCGSTPTSPPSTPTPPPSTPDGGDGDDDGAETPSPSTDGDYGAETPSPSTDGNDDAETPSPSTPTPPPSTPPPSNSPVDPLTAACINCNSPDPSTPFTTETKIRATTASTCGPLMVNVMGAACWRDIVGGLRKYECPTCMVKNDGPSIVIGNHCKDGDHVEWSVNADNAMGQNATKMCYLSFTGSRRRLHPSNLRGTS